MILISKKRRKVFFSIITVTKNSHATLEKCIKSVANQTFKSYEHIIIDGCSDNKTIKIIKKNSKKISYSISEKDKNLWEAINKGIKASKGQVICILNSDDIFFKNALKIAYKYFKKKKLITCLVQLKKLKFTIIFILKKFIISLIFFPHIQWDFLLKREFITNLDCIMKTWIIALIMILSLDW